jgi:invasion protein IalB
MPFGRFGLAIALCLAAGAAAAQSQRQQPAPATTVYGPFGEWRTECTTEDPITRERLRECAIIAQPRYQSPNGDAVYFNILLIYRRRGLHSVAVAPDSGFDQASGLRVAIDDRPALAGLACDGLLCKAENPAAARRAVGSEQGLRNGTRLTARFRTRLTQQSEWFDVAIELPLVGFARARDLAGRFIGPF